MGTFSYCFHHPRIFAYLRTSEDGKLLVVNNFYGEPVQFELPGTLDGVAEILISNYPDSPLDFHSFTLRPYESVVYFLTES